MSDHPQPSRSARANRSPVLIKPFRLAVALLALVSAAAGIAAVPIPDEARLVRLAVPGNGTVIIDDTRYRISAAAQIRDPNNRIVVPASLRGGVYRARVIVDRNGDLWRAWLLRPRGGRAPEDPH